MFYRVSFEFRLTRHIVWSSDGSDFYDHVDQVSDKLRAHESVSDVRAITHLGDSCLILDFELESSGSAVVVGEALEVVRHAIESSGARHFGMESATQGRLVGAGAVPGLDTPIWHKRRILVDVAA